VRRTAASGTASDRRTDPRARCRPMGRHLPTCGVREPSRLSTAVADASSGLVRSRLPLLPWLHRTHRAGCRGREQQRDHGRSPSALSAQPAGGRGAVTTRSRPGIPRSARRPRRRHGHARTSHTC
jgi:hypothetical protein